MRIKGIYDSVIRGIERLIERVDHLKTVIAEDRAIALKKPIYSSVQWTPEQQRQFDKYWLKVYGKKIPNKWHRLYEAANGVFAVDYIPEKMYTTKIEPALNDRRYAMALEDKSMVETLSRDCKCIVPETIVLCTGGQFLDHDRKPISKDKAIDELIGKAFVLKPTVGSSSGHGVTFVQEDEADKQCITTLLAKQGKDFIVQSVIQQHPIFASFNNSSINTIRITTFIADDSIHYVPLAFRMGRKDKRVDNIHAGGIVVGVRDDGTLLANAYELGYGTKTVKYQKHPDSQIIFSSIRLPAIPDVIQAAYRVHSRMPHIGIISWDFTVDKDANAVLIEANISGQSIWFPQIVNGKGAFVEYTSSVLRRIAKG